MSNEQHGYQRKHNVRFRELERILLRHGFEERQAGKGLSHYVFSHPDITQNVVLVTHGKNDFVKAYQVNDVINALEELAEPQ